jgi:hypothetical protein
MQCRALQRSSVCRVCRTRKSLLCHVVAQSNSHASLTKSPLIPPTILCDPPVSSQFSSSHRRKVHLSAVVYAPDVPEANMATSEIAFATGNENKLKEVGVLAILFAQGKIQRLPFPSRWSPYWRLAIPCLSRSVEQMLIFQSYRSVLFFATVCCFMLLC